MSTWDILDLEVETMRRRGCRATILIKSCQDITCEFFALLDPVTLNINAVYPRASLLSVINQMPKF